MFLQHKPVIVRFRRATLKKVLEVLNLVVAIVDVIVLQLTTLPRVTRKRFVESHCEANQVADGDVKASNYAIIAQLKRFSVECATACRNNPAKKLLTQELVCNEIVRQKLTNDDLIAEKVDKAMGEALFFSGCSEQIVAIAFIVNCHWQHVRL